MKSLFLFIKSVSLRLKVQSIKLKLLKKYESKQSFLASYYGAFRP